MDREFIIDIILRARDEMAGTLAKATGEIAAFDEATRRSQEAQSRSIKQNKDLAKAVETRAASEERLARLLKQQGLTQSSQIKQLQDLRKAHNDLAQAQKGTDPAKEASALDRVLKARKSLIDSITGENRARAGFATARVNQLEKEIRLQSQVNASSLSRIQTEKAVAEAVKTFDAEIEKSRRDSMRRLDQLDAQDVQARKSRRRQEAADIEAEQRRLAQRAADFERLTSRAQRPAQTLAGTNVSQTEEIRATRELATVRQLLIQRGFEQATVDHELHSIRQDALRDYGHLNQASRDAARVAHDEAEAYRVVEDAARKLEGARKIAGRTGRPVSGELENVGTTNIGQTRVQQGGFGQFLGILTQAKKEFADLDTSTSGFTTHLRGAFGFAAVTMIQPLIALLAGVVSVFLSIASAAAAAGAAIGAIFLSAVAQGIPVIGVFGAALQRLGTVFNFVQAGLQQQQQAFMAHYQTMVQNKLGINQVVIAQHSLVDALAAYRTAVINVGNAELGLRTARQQAIRQLQDLITQETNARLAAEASSLAVQHSQRALAAAVATGGDVQSAQLDLASAQAQHSQAVTGAQRAIADASQGSVARANIQSTVQAASQGVDQAKRAVVDAQFQIAQAQAAVITAQQAARGYNLATAAQLAYLRSQMSKTELALAGSITRILGLFRGANAYMRPITDAILGPFVLLTNRIYSILKDPRIFGALRELATTIGGAITSATKSLTDPQAMQGFINLIHAATQNIGPFAKIIVDLIRGAGGIANAAIPFVHTFLLFIQGAADKFAAWSSSSKGQNWLKNFFDVAFRSLQAFVKLGGSIGRLILDVIGTGGGAQSGINVLKTLQGWIDSTASSIEHHGKVFKELQQLWSIAVPTVKILGGVLGAVGDAFLKLGTSKQGQDSLKNLGDFLVRVVVPAFVQFVIEIGKATGLLLNFLDKHPQLEKLLVTLVASGLALSVAFKGIGLIFGPLAAVLGFMQKIAKAIEVLQILLPETEAGFVATFLAPAAPIIALVALIVGLAAVTGNMHNLARTLAAPFVAAWAQIKKPLQDLGKQFLYFANGVLGIFGVHVRNLKTLFHDVFAGILTVVRTLFSLVGKSIGDTIGGIIKTISGLFEIIGGLLHGNFHKVLDGFKKIGQGMLQGLLGGIGDLGKTLFNLFFNAVWGILGDVEKLGEKIIDAIIKGIKKAPGKIAGEIGKLVPHVNIGPIHLASGGPVAGGYGGGDSVSARLEPGEHVFTKEEVRAAGGHGAMYALRSALGGGRQALGRAYADGGGIFSTMGMQGSGRVAQGVTGDFGSVLSNVQLFVARFEGDWVGLWTSINKTTNDKLNQQFTYFTNFFNNLDEKFKTWWDDTNQNASDQLDKLLSNFRWAYNKIDTDTFNAFWYINHAADVSLKSFGAKPADVHLGAVPKFAGGGWIGNRGEKGRDTVHALLGRGEAVLNYGHQAIVEPALRAFYGFGLDKMFARTGGTHAGPGGMGFASGGVVLDSGVNMSVGQEPAILQALRALAQRLRETVYVISGYRSPSHSVSVGGFSNDPHTEGKAADIGIGAPIRNTMFAIREAILNKVGLYRPFYPASAAEVNHVRLLKGAIAQGLANITGGIGSPGTTATAPKNIADIAVRGSGVLATLLRAAVGKTTGSANSFLQSQIGGSPGGGLGGLFSGPSGPAAARRWTERAMKIAGVSGRLWENMLLRQEGRESSWNPNAINRTDSNAAAGDPSRGIMQTIGSTFRQYALPGYNRNIYDPISNIIAAIRYIIAKYGGGNATRGAQVMWDRGGGAYAGGGFVGGARNIIGHVGEWVVNKSQQSKLAGWLGTSVGNLKGAMGFTGGPHSFAGGGEIQDSGPWRVAPPPPVNTGATIGKTGQFGLPDAIKLTPVFTQALLAVYNAAQRRVAQRLEENAKTLDKGIKQFLANYNKVGGDGGIFDLAQQAIDNYINEQSTLVSLAAAGARIINGRLQYGRAQTAVGAATSALNATNREITKLQGLRHDEQVALESINSQIKKIGTPKTAAQKKEYQQLLGARQQLVNRIDTADGELAQSLSTKYQQQVDLFNAQVAKALRPSQQRSNFAAMVHNIAQVFGNPASIQSSDRGILQAAVSQQAALQNAYNEAAKKAKKDPRWQSVADDLLGQLQNAAVATAQAQIQGLTDAMTAADTQNQIGTSWLDMLNRVAQVQQASGNQLGGIQSQIGISRGRSGFLQSQIGQYQGLLGQAQAIGDTNAVNELTQKIFDLTAQVAEANLQTQQLITAYRQVSVTILSTISQVRGGLIGSASSIIQTLGQISGSLNLPQQIAILHDSATFLVSEGSKAVQNIIDTINDPNGPFGGNSGQANSFLGQAMAAFNQGPAAFATWLGANAGAISGFEAGLPPDQQTLFQGLLQALIDNTTSQVDNTQQLQQLNGMTNQQQFTSSAWNLFRQAIFTGLGTLLPTYAMTVPSMDVGGVLQSDGLLYGHKHEVMLPARVAKGSMNAGGDTNVEVYLTSPTEVADPVYLGNKIAWDINHNPNNR